MHLFSNTLVILSTLVMHAQTDRVLVALKLAWEHVDAPWGFLKLNLEMLFRAFSWVYKHNFPLSDKFVKFVLYIHLNFELPAGATKSFDLQRSLKTTIFAFKLNFKMLLASLLHS